MRKLIGLVVVVALGLGANARGEFVPGNWVYRRCVENGYEAIFR